MHEASIAQYALEMINDQIDGDPLAKKENLREIVFDLSIPYTVYPDSFEFYFTELVKGTPLAGVKLTFNESDKVVGFFLSSLIFDD